MLTIVVKYAIIYTPVNISERERAVFPGEMVILLARNKLNEQGKEYSH